MKNIKTFIKKQTRNIYGPNFKINDQQAIDAIKQWKGKFYLSPGKKLLLISRILGYFERKFT